MSSLKSNALSPCGPKTQELQRDIPVQSSENVLSDTEDLIENSVLFLKGK